MKLKGLNEYDICNYKEPAMFLIFPYCTFKCDKECGRPICQNSALAHEPIIEIRVADIVQRYLNNPLTHAVVCGGLEPFDSAQDLFLFITYFRMFSKDPIVIYTGYNKEELSEQISFIKNFNNIIVKFGRFIPNSPHTFDAVLGVELASNNQYAELFMRGIYDEYSATNSGKDKIEEHSHGK